MAQESSQRHLCVELVPNRQGTRADHVTPRAQRRLSRPSILGQTALHMEKPEHTGLFRSRGIEGTKVTVSQGNSFLQMSRIQLHTFGTNRTTSPLCLANQYPDISHLSLGEAHSRSICRSNWGTNLVISSIDICLPGLESALSRVVQQSMALTQASPCS